MPKDSPEKTASAHSPKLFYIGIALLAIVVAVNPISRNALACATYNMPTSGTATVSSNVFKTETVDTIASREKGLSGRPCIKNDQAMLFTFDESDTSNHCFWMKDMRFAIDIVWLDSNKRVVYIASGVEPSSYPDSYCPGAPTRYTMELKKGQAARVGITIGSKVIF